MGYEELYGKREDVINLKPSISLNFKAAEKREEKRIYMKREIGINWIIVGIGKLMWHILK